MNILYTAWWLKSMLSKELKVFELTHEQYNVLRILKGKHPEQMCVKDIGGRMIEPSSNVPRIIDRLVAKHFVERATSASDKRETVITLTNVGINVLKQATVTVNNIMQQRIQMKEADALELNNLLENMRVDQ